MERLGIGHCSFLFILWLFRHFDAYLVIFPVCESSVRYGVALTINDIAFYIDIFVGAVHGQILETKSKKSI